MRDFEMDKIAEVGIPPLSKRPRLDIVENQSNSTQPYDKITFEDVEGKRTEAGFHSRKEKSDVLDQSKNGVTENNMADIVSVDSSKSVSENHLTAAPDEDKNGDDTVDGNDSDISDISNLSGESELAWRPIAGPMSWVQEQIVSGKDPRVILRKLVPDPEIIPDHLDDLTLWRLVVSIVTEPPSRKKLKHINTIDDVVSLLKSAKKIMVLTGAGVSVSCGIPDFRSRNGIYARLAVDFPDLPDPQAMFDIKYFKHDPRPFFKFAKEIYPGQFEPSHGHKFISLLERQGKLLRNYTQNIDTLEQVAGISNVIQCHGSFATATCMKCRHKVDAEAIRADIFNQVIPHCPKCTPSDEAIMKPDIVFFGESLPEEFHSQMAADKDVCDLLIVVGSSLKVRPVALIPNSLPPEIPQILINREPLGHLNFDVELLGDCDVVLGELCHMLGNGWSELFSHYTPKEQVTKGDLLTPTISESDSKEVGSTVPQTLEQSCSSVSSSTDSKSIQPQSSCDSHDAENLILGTPQVSTSENTLISSTKSQVVNSTESSGQAKGNNQINSDTKGSNSDDLSVMSCDSEMPTQSSSNSSAEDVRNWWQSKHTTISSRLSSDQFLFVPPNRYVFTGAEVYSDDSDDDLLNNDDDTSDFNDSESESEPKGSDGAVVENGLSDTVDPKVENESGSEIIESRGSGDKKPDIKATVCDGQTFVGPDCGAGDNKDHSMELISKMKSETAVNNQHWDFKGKISETADSSTIIRTEANSD